MRVLIIGGTGFISGEIARQAAGAGHEVTVFNRGRSGAPHPYNVITGDADNLLAHKKELRDLNPDVVVHSVAHTEKHAQDLVAVFEGSPAHLVVLGSADCYQAFWDLNTGRDDSDQPQREDAPLARKKHYWKDFAKHAGGDQYDKNLMTAVLMRAHEKGKVLPTVFRLPMVYGPGDPQYAYRHGKVIRHLIDGQKEIVMSGVEQATLFTYGYVDNIAAAVVHSFGLRQTMGAIYNLGESEVRTKRRWADLYAAAAGRALAHRILPPEVLHGHGFDQTPEHIILDTSKFRRDTGFRDPVGLSETVKKTYDWAVQNPDCLKKVVVEYETMRVLADAYKGCIDAFNKKLQPPPPGGP